MAGVEINTESMLRACLLLFATSALAGAKVLVPISDFFSAWPLWGD